MIVIYYINYMYFKVNCIRYFTKCMYNLSIIWTINMKNISENLQNVYIMLFILLFYILVYIRNCIYNIYSYIKLKF